MTPNLISVWRSIVDLMGVLLPGASAARACCLVTLCGFAQLAGTSTGLAAEIRVAGRVVLPGSAAAAVTGAQIELLPAVESYEAAKARLSGSPAPAPLAATHPAPDGSFALKAPGPGCYRLAVGAGGYLSMQYRLSPLVEDQELPSVRLEPASRFTVQAVGPRGEPLPGILLEVSRLYGGQDGPRWRLAPRAGRTGADGRLTMARGPREIPRSIQALQLSAIDPRFWGQKGEASETTTLLRLSRGAPFVVEVRGPDGKPVAGALMRLGGGPPIAVAGNNGRLPMASDDRTSAASEMSFESPAGDLWAEVSVDRLRGAVARVDVAPPLDVAGDLVDAVSRQPVGGGLVWAEGSSLPPTAVSLAGRDGRFQLRMPLGRGVRLNAAAPGYLPARLEVRRRGGAEAAVRLELERAVVVAGLVLDRAGAPIAGAEVTAVEAGAQAELRGTFRADSMGRFRITALAAGKPYRLVAGAPGFAPASILVEPPGPTSGPAPPAVPGAPRAAPPLRIVLDEGGSILAKVADRAGRPLSGIVLNLEPLNLCDGSWGASWPGTEPPETRSDTAGKLELAHLPPGLYHLRATGQGFSPISPPDVELLATAPRLDLGTLTMEPGGAIEAQVVDSRGAPVPEAVVIAQRSRQGQPPGVFDRLGLDDLPIFVSGGRDGKVRVADLPRGALYDLSAAHPDHPVASVAGVEVPTREPLRIEVRDGRRLTGRVVDADGHPVAGASVAAAESALAGLGLTSSSGQRLTTLPARTDARGEFSISGLAAGTGPVQLEVTAAGYRTARLPGVQVPDGQEVRPFEIVLEPGGFLAGRVHDAADHSIVASVTVWPKSMAAKFEQLLGPASAETDADGRYRVDGLEPGIYQVTANRQRVEVEIRPGRNDLDLLVEDPQGWDVSGKVLDTAGGALSQARVQIHSSSESTSVLTFSDGSFSFTGVADGTYALTISRRGYAPLSSSASVVVAGAAVTGLELTLARARAAITGRLLGLEPDELAHGAVEATPIVEAAEWPSTGFDFTSHDSQEVDPASGRYRIGELTPGAWLVTAMIGRNRSASGRVRLAPETPEGSLDLDFSTRATLSGKVTLGERPLAAALVNLASRDIPFPATTQTAADGTFALSGLSPGTYSLVISDPLLGVAASRTIELGADQDVAVALESGALHGTVVATATQQPVADAVVVLQRRDMGPPSFLGSPATRTDDAGTFEFSSIATGPYKVTVTKPGLAPSQATLDVTANATASIQVQLGRP